MRKENGSLTRQLMAKPFGDKCEVIEFDEMLHGWCTRGDITDPKVARDVELSIKFTLEYITKNI